MKFLKKYWPHILLVIYIPVFAYLAIDPYSRATWWAENVPVLFIVLGLALTISKFRFSNLAYSAMAFWIFWHTVGGYYTFERVPFDFVNDLFGFERNMFDRFGHFMIGFFALPIAELVTRKKLITNKVMVILFSLFAIVTLAAFYELFEWQYAVLFGGENASDFLGSQGDIWDAQKDMLCDTLGAVSVLGLFFLRKK